ncbi:response regulator, partial [bacterium]|nr:response regulator [bacterium]
MGGRMWVESEPNQGATFHIELPVVPCEEPAEVIDEPVPELAGADEDANPGGRVRRLLVVDDEPGILEVLKLSLGDAGYRVETAANGTEALRRLESSGIDLVISDLQMPDVSGEELYAKLKESQPRLARRFLFLTGDTLSPDARTFLEGCGARWFSKPFNLRDIEDAVNRILRPEPLAAILGTANPPR